MVIKIPVVLSYSNKGTKQATRDIKGLDKTLKKFGLSSKLSLAAATTALTVFTKRSIMAAAADDKAQRSLARSLKNLGLAYSSVNVEQFIKDTSLATGVADDQLRPALQRLVTATGSVAKSQELLNTALNISAGTGKDLQSVTTALTKAYLGNNTSLGRLGAGLTKAELKGASFEELVGRLNVLFAGQAAEAAGSYAGQIDRLKVAAKEASEVIGTELLNSINRLSGENGLGDATDNMTNFGNSTANVISGVTTIAEKIKPLIKLVGKLNVDLGSLFTKNKSLANQPILTALSGLGAPTRQEPMRPNVRGIEREALIAQQKATELAKAAAAAKAKELAAQRALATSKKLAAKFDQENIAIEAALKGKLSDEDKARVLALKAIKTEAVADDQKALADLEEAQQKGAAAELARIKEAETARTASIAKQKSEFQALQEWLASNPLKVYTTAILNGVAVTAPGSFGLPATNASSSAPPNTNVSPSLATGTALAPAGGAGTGNITVNVSAGTIADENKLTYIISNELTKFVRFGGITAPAGFI